MSQFLQNYLPVNRSLIPGILTTGNLFCGFLSVKCAFQGEFVTAAWLIILAGIFDGLDGTVARITKSYSKFGVELDSFADVVSFGLAPAVLIYAWHFNELGILGIAISFLPLMFGAFRLARFNVGFSRFDEKENFIGLPIPVQAVSLASYLIFCETIWSRVRFPMFLVPFVVLLCLLMVSQVEYETYPKFRLRGDRKNKAKFIIFIIFFTLVVLYPKVAFFPICLAFVLFGLIKGAFHHLHDEDEVVDLPV